MNLTGIRFPQRISQSDQEAQIDMNEYICEMLNYLKDASLLRTLGLHLLLKALCSMFRRLFLGLIPNEAVTNSIKYGRAKNRKLEIAVAL